VRALAVNPSGDIFAGTDPFFGVYRSTDNGETWTAVTKGLTCGNIWSLVINPDGDIFAGTAGCGTGVFRSTDNGDNWALANNGLTSTDIGALAINANGDIFAGTHSQFGVGGGMFRSTPPRGDAVGAVLDGEQPNSANGTLTRVAPSFTGAPRFAL
jgi:photosystem II stability/assembly factor-like uncharacterized protein